jgi:hypothetical protein
MPFKRFIGYIPVGSPADPDFGIPDFPGFAPVDPGFGNPRPPVDPGYGIGAGLRPGNDLPKPPGVPILPPSPDNGLPPAGLPWMPGHWVPIDPGYGNPPIFGFVPVDPGFGAPAPPGPDNALPGHWVPIDPDYGKPERPCGGTKPVRPVWAWIAHIGPDFGVLPAPAPPPAQPK